MWWDQGRMGGSVIESLLMRKGQKEEQKLQVLGL